VEAPLDDTSTYFFHLRKEPLPNQTTEAQGYSLRSDFLQRTKKAAASGISTLLCIRAYEQRVRLRTRVALRKKGTSTKHRTRFAAQFVDQVSDVSLTPQCYFPLVFLDSIARSLQVRRQVKSKTLNSKKSMFDASSFEIHANDRESKVKVKQRAASLNKQSK